MGRPTAMMNLYLLYIGILFTSLVRPMHTWVSLSILTLHGILLVETSTCEKVLKVRVRKIPVSSPKFHPGLPEYQSKSRTTKATVCGRKKSFNLLFMLFKKTCQFQKCRKE